MLPATSWTVLWSNLGGDRISFPVQTSPKPHPATCTLGKGAHTLELKRPEQGTNIHSHVPQRLKICIAVFISINSVSHGLLWCDIIFHAPYVYKSPDFNLFTVIQINNILLLQTTSHPLLMEGTLLHCLNHKYDLHRIT